MDILIISQFGSTFSENDNDRFLYLAKMLSSSNEVEIVTSGFCHEKKIHRDKPEKEWPMKITFINEPGYSKNICFKRFFSHIVWGRNLKRYLESRKKPDIIYCAVPSLSGPYLSAKFCERNDVRFIIDVQDLWPEAFKMIFNPPVVGRIIYFPFKYLADGVYRRADEIVAVSESYVQRARMVNHKCSNGLSIFLGTDLDTFDKNSTKKVEYEKKDFWIGYCGTLGSSYDLTIVFDALEILKEKYDLSAKFVVMGDGPLKEQFEEYAEKKRLNTLFIGRVPYNIMCSVLKMCDVAVNPIMHNAAQSIINKHADYVAAGIPIISTQECEEFRDLIDTYNMGINCENGNAQQVADAIYLYMNDNNKRLECGKNSRRCAVEKFNRKNTYNSIVSVINDIE